MERELERARASRDELAERIARHLPKDGTLEAAPGLFIAKAIELFRKNAEKPLRVAGFARQIGLFPEIDLRL